ncbi:MAG TPA: class I SAM-dependent methyltransferase [Steroidobacteraceae bacterium]|nr:class I SAM-dependent methyltransferase [Steroidobacteraceae bacterium]
MFDEGFYRRYYVDPETRVASREDTVRLGRFVCAYAAYLGFTVKRVLDAGCGLGHLRQPVREYFPRARYVGLETSDWLCRRHGWTRGSIARYAPKQPFDLVFCHDVLQYLDDREAVRALANLGRLSRGALYFSVLTREDWRRNADRSRTDGNVCLRPAAWYRSRLARKFRPLGGGLLVRRGFHPLLWELERPW